MPMANRSFAAILALAVWQAFALCPPGAARAEEPPDFARDVVPILTKAGCNAGACHGSLQGRGGFRLSLLGFDPAADYETITLDLRGRRVQPSSPENSLVLRKASGAMPHGGGVRLAADSTGYRVLRDYIALGLPAPKANAPTITRLAVTPAEALLQPNAPLPLKVTARWSDGLERDVTAWSLYDSRDPMAVEVTPSGQITSLRAGKSSVSVRYQGHVASVGVTTPFADPAPIEFTPANFIDELALAEWKRIGVAPAPLCSDTDFLRRAHLDLIGTLPTPDEVRAFVASMDSDKRRKLIAQLLERPEYAEYWSLKWGDLLRVHRRYVGDKGLGSFSGWLKQSIRDNKPLDAMTRELLTSQGNLFANGPVAYYFVDQKPEELAETTAQLFLGVRLQCARCHHHPMEVWSQDDYYGLAAFFTRLEVRDNGDKGRFGGMQIVRPVAHETRKLQVASPPRLFGDATPVDPDAGDIRQALADWITQRDNPFFARNFANRYWAYLVGRGLVEPIDDMRATNPPTNAALLDALAKDFAEHGFDAKHLIRTICTSQVYQLSTRFDDERDKDGTLFTHRMPRRMPAEVLLDAINQATGFSESFAGTPPGTRAISLPDPTVQSEFLATFGRPQRNNPCECARESSPDLLQALHLINNAGLQNKIARKEGRVAESLARQLSDDQIAEELYLATFSRVPAADEIETIRTLAPNAPNKQELFEDLLWTLLNSPEFAFNH
jgi:hypothetical protein